MRSFLLLPLGSLALFAAGCDGDIGGDPGVPGPPDTPPQAVPAAPAALEVHAVCAPLASGERLLSVSPEGQAWLIREGSPTALRVLDAFGGAIAEVAEEVDLDGVGDAQAWSGGDAALATADGLWRLDDFARISLTTPEGFEAPGSLCGDPATSGVLVSQGEVFERRSDGWWRWAPAGEDGGAPARVLRQDGECRGRDDAMWLRADDGTLLRAEAQTFTRPIRFDGLRDATVSDGLVAALDARYLWVDAGEGFGAWEFAAGGLPTALSASAGKLWMVSGERVLRFDGAEWRSVDAGLATPPQGVSAHADGAWVVGASEICHVAPGAELRVEGVRPNLRGTELEYPIRVRAADASEAVAVVADVDGAPVELTEDAEPGWLTGAVRLETIGWHTLTLTAGDTSRAIALKRAPEVERSWEADIQPIYAASCGGNTCHRSGVSDPPDLGSYAAWTARAGALRVRVVEGKTMPPAANRGPEWGDDDVTIIQEWLEGGMLP